MFSSEAILVAVVVYMAALIGLAVYADRKTGWGARFARSGVVYALSLAVYCTSWTYFGSTGKAANSGMIFLTIYLGPTLAFLVGRGFITRIIELKNKHRTTSIADFIAQLYDRSSAVAALVTLISIVGIAPYIALQIKSVTSAVWQMTGTTAATGSWASAHLPGITVIFMILFTIAFGMRRLDAAEQHQGMIVSVAAESLVKLTSFLVIGVFVTYFLFDGFADVFSRFTEIPAMTGWPSENNSAGYYVKWFTYLVLAASAILFLPRQFHVMVTENTDRRHLLTAMWLFPAYLVLINIFVLPIAVAGIAKGLPPSSADGYVLQLPLLYGSSFLPMIAFIGGFSASTAMVIVCSTTVATMVSNHLILPVLSKARYSRPVRAHLLPIRWVAAAGVVATGYGVERVLGDSYALVNMGMISFAAAVQFAPAVLAGVYWHKATKLGGILGIGGGALTWAYTLLIPSFVNSGWLPTGLLEHGPFGLSLLRPTAMLGLNGLDELSHGVFWSLLINVTLLTMGSILTRPGSGRGDPREESDGDHPYRAPNLGLKTENLANSRAKLATISSLLSSFMPDARAERLIRDSLQASDIEDANGMTMNEFASFHGHLLRGLSGIVGSVEAYRVLELETLLSAAEYTSLRQIYSSMLADLEVTPEELRKKLDFHRERGRLIAAQARELEIKVEERTRDLQESKTRLEEEVIRRAETEVELRQSEQRFRAITDSAKDAIIMLDSSGRVILWNPAAERLFGYAQDQALTMLLGEFLRARDRNPDWTHIMLDERGGEVASVLQLLGVRSDGLEFPCEVSVASVELADLRHIVAIVRDITELESTRQQLLQSEKLAAIGTLAAGVAHEINNPVGYVKSNLNTMQKYLRTMRDYMSSAPDQSDDVSQEQHRIKTIMEDFEDAVMESIEGARRVEGIVSNLKAFSRIDSPGYELANLNDGLETTLSVAWNELKYKAEVTRDYGDIPDIPCSLNQLNQVFLNLLVNAAHAIEEGKGRITVKTWADEHQVYVSVSDNGMGISDDNLTRIFEPFFTTKEVGKGTGLGLSLSYDIVRKHDGEVAVDSEPGRGTEFIVALPRSRPDTARASTSEAPSSAECPADEPTG